MRKRKRKKEPASSSRSSADPVQPLEGRSDIGSSQLQLIDPSQFEGQSPDGHRIVGSLDAIVGHTVEGWAMNVQDPLKPVTVDIFDGDLLLGNAVAFMFRPELLAAGIGTGNHYFKFVLPESVFDGDVHVISARAAGSTQNRSIQPPKAAKRAAKIAIETPPITKSDEITAGMLEVVSDDGWVRGWACYPRLPGRRVEIEVVVDGEVVGDTVAALHRSDLESAGIGDGNCSFVFVLPHEVLTRPKGSLVSVRDKQTGRVLPEPRLFQRREIANAIERLSELENDARLLNSTVTLATEQAAANERATADLFRTVGDFFFQLANVTAAGKPPGSLQTLRGAIDNVTSKFPMIEFSIPSDPQLSICVEATGSLENIYNTLRSIACFQSDNATEVVLFDSGTCDEASLLPLVVRNLRYLHTGEGSRPVGSRNRAAEFARGEIIIFLAGFAEPASDWIDPIVSAFQIDHSLAMVGAKVLRSDGVLENAGITLINEQLEVIGLGADPSSEAYSQRRHIDAVTSEAFAVRREAWQRGHGLDEKVASLESALVDFCIRTSAADGTIQYEPAFEVVLRR
jgi:hypothetical protein